MQLIQNEEDIESGTIMIAYSIIRDLATRVAERAASKENQQVRDNWKEHNSLKKARTPVVCRIYPPAAYEIIDPPVSTDPLARQIEERLRVQNLKIDLDDDELFDPWYELSAVFEDTNSRFFGIEPDYERPNEVGLDGIGAYRHKRVIKETADIEKLRSPSQRIDEEATERLRERAEEILGSTLEVRINRMQIAGATLGYPAMVLLGLDGLMYDLVDRPELVHALMTRMRDCVIACNLEGERLGRLQLNQSAILSTRGCCTHDLPQAGFDGQHVRLRDLWGGSNGQEFDIVSPDMTEEFLMQYELPLLKMFGLVMYGCCECHHGKWHLYRKIPNLRVLSVSPWTDLEEAISEMGKSIVYNWRVNVSDVVTKASPEAMRAEIRRAMEIARGYNIEVVLQDVETVYHRKDLLYTWTRIAREEVER